MKIEAMTLACGPAGLLDALTGEEDPVVLESSALHETYGRYTVMTCCPVEVLTLREGALTDRAGDVLAAGDDRDIWSALDAAMRPKLRSPPPADAGYLPGWFGYVGYEVGRHIERLPGRSVRDTRLPDLRLAFHDAVLVYDGLARTWRLAELETDDPPPLAGRAARSLRRIVELARGAAPDAAPAPVERADAAARPAVTARSNFEPDEYRRAVARCIEYIAAGDIFQVNLSQRLTVRPAPPAATIYRSLRRRNPAWYAAYVSFDSLGCPCAVVSSSPELFLRLRGGRVVTRPIKGTRPRLGDAAADRAAMADLWSSPKDNAELAMIIDLLRNDLGRVCRFGSVRVVEPRRLETHPTVFHLVGTVEGELRRGEGVADLLRATFPGGSVTGAPKIRAMEIIDELEPCARGVYTGCIGTVGVDGSCEWNMAIRTVVRDGDTAYVQVGGGIVTDSDPQAEYEETLHKARAMLEAIRDAQGAPK